MLLDVVRSMSGRKFEAPTVRQLLQPEGLPGLTASSGQAAKILFAARELELIADQADGMIRPARPRDNRSAKAALIDAIDEKVLSGDDKTEPWFALFYAFLLGRDAFAGSSPKSGMDWESRFERELFSGTTPVNRFNLDKYRGLRRWFRYSGLGWHDSDGSFHPNPYDRVARRLPAVFGKARELDVDAFMERLSGTCPELDGGHVFLRANPGWSRSGRTMSLGLAHALVDLHLDQMIVLNCPLDSDGWSIVKASPPRDTNLVSDRVTSVRLLRSGKRADG
jgi:hypothetical protein